MLLIKRILVILVAVLAVLGLASALPANAKPQPLTLHKSSPFQVASSIDTQGCYPSGDQSCWVRNPTGCFDSFNNGLCGGYAWGDQDDVYYSGSGYVDPAAPMKFQEGLFADFYTPPGGLGNSPHSIYVQVTSPKPNVNVSLANDHGDSWQLGSPVKNGNRYIWLFCTRDAVAARGSGPNGWPVVPNSNYLPGSTTYGYAEPVVYTLTVAASGRTASDVTADFEIAASGPLAFAPRTIKNCTT